MMDLNPGDNVWCWKDDCLQPAIFLKEYLTTISLKREEIFETSKDNIFKSKEDALNAKIRSSEERQ